MIKNENEPKKQLTKAELRKNRIRNRRLLRAGIQALFFFTMPGAFVAGFSGVKYLFQWIGAGEVLQRNNFTMVLIVLCLFTFLTGRFFCGYVCAFGTLGDFVSWLSGIIQIKGLKRKKKFSLPDRVVRVLQLLKYLNLMFIIIMCALGAYGKLSGTSCWDVFSMLTSLKMVSDKYLVGIICLIIVLAGMALQERFFCQFLCPMGALFALLPVLPWGMVRRNNETCPKKCSICKDQCPVSLRLESDGMRNGECIACEKCISACPRGNISRTESKWINAYAGVLVRGVIFFIAGCFLGLCRLF